MSFSKKISHFANTIEILKLLMYDWMWNALKLQVT